MFLKKLMMIVSLFALAVIPAAAQEETERPEAWDADHTQERFYWHDKWFTPFMASQVDPRFSYGLYVPVDYDENGDKEYPLVVLIHGTERSPGQYLRFNEEFAEEKDVILLAPMFPVGTHGQYDLENYKLIEHQGTRYDLILLSMVDEVATKYRIDSTRFYLHGFSGGGHFAHRFYYLHPHRLKALSIGAAGMITRPNLEKDWWVGVKDLKWRFNARVNFDRMRQVPVQIVIGEEDNESWAQFSEIERHSPYRMEYEPDATYTAAGDGRLDRAKTLMADYEEIGIDVRMDIVPDAGHDETLMAPTVQTFFSEFLAED